MTLQYAIMAAANTGMVSVEAKKGEKANLHRPLMTFIMGAFPEQQEVNNRVGGGNGFIYSIYSFGPPFTSLKI